MKSLPTYLWAIVSVCVIYAAITFIIFLRLKIVLKNANLATFKRILGGNYQFRTQTSGLIKYKWRLMFMIIKASFDAEGQMQEWKIKLFTFFPFTYRSSLG